MNMLRVVSRLGASAILLTLLVPACREPITEPPPPPHIEIAPPYLWGVGEISLTSPAFREFALVPQAGSEGFFDVLNRWSNFNVALAGDTLDSWRLDDTTLVAGYTGADRWSYGLESGSYSLSVVMDEQRVLEQEFTVVGMHEPVTWVGWGLIPLSTHSYVRPMPWKGGQIILPAYEPPRGWGAAIYDLRSGDGWMVGDLRVDHQVHDHLTTPGPSFAADHVVLDLTADGGGPQSYRVGTTLEPARELECTPSPQSSYFAAEVAPGRCLAWVDARYGHEDGFWVDGQTLVAPTPYERYYWQARHLSYEGIFEISPTGERVIPVALGCHSVARDGWWVFDATPAVAYRLDGVGCVGGVEFSADGDTLILVTRDTTRQNSAEAVWALQLRRADDGTLIRSVEVPGVSSLSDLLLDPVRPWVYSYGAPNLVVAHRESLEVLARVPGSWSYGSERLVFGGSNGVVYSCSDEGVINAFDTPARYPP